MLTNLLDINVPIIQAPMAGGATTPELVAAVCNAGGLGSFGAGYMSPDALSAAIDKVRTLTDKNFQVNLFVPESHDASLVSQQKMAAHINQVASSLAIDTQPVEPPYLPDFYQQVGVLLEKKVPIVSFTFGIPDKKIIARFKSNNVILIGTATSLAETLAVQESGIDAISLQSKEAGGHRGTFIGDVFEGLTDSKTLIAQVSAKIQLPVIAAGGIMNGQHIKEALQQGAQAAQLGTAFLSCTESGINDTYKQALLNQTSDTTVLTKAFSGKFARSICNQFIDQMIEYEDDILEYPIQNALTGVMRQAAAKQHNPEFMSLYAGQRVYLSRAMTATELMAQLIREM